MNCCMIEPLKLFNNNLTILHDQWNRNSLICTQCDRPRPRLVFVTLMIISFLLQGLLSVPLPQIPFFLLCPFAIVRRRTSPALAGHALAVAHLDTIQKNSFYWTLS